MSTGQSLLEAGDLTVSFDGFKALNALNFVMYEGQLTVIIGPNGAGKTTLLDVVTGRTRADTGSIIFDGRSITGLPDYRIARLGIGRKFQTPSVFPDLTVMENLVLAGRRSKSVFGTLFKGMSTDDRARLDDILHTIGLERRRGDPAGALSHGERQWLEIGMVLAQRPKLMLIDEPIAGMTAQEAVKTADILRRISGECSVLVVEHDMDFVKQIAERVSVFHQGSLLTEGSFERVSADPRVKEIYLGKDTHHGE